MYAPAAAAAQWFTCAEQNKQEAKNKWTKARTSAGVKVCESKVCPVYMRVFYFCSCADVGVCLE